MSNARASVLSTALLSLIMGGTAAASPDLVIDYTNVELHTAGPNWDSGIVVVPMNANSPNTGYSQAQPYPLRCDLTDMNGGIWYSYASAGATVYPEIVVSFYLNGDENDKIVSTGKNDTVPSGFDHVNAVLPGLQDRHSSDAGYIPISSTDPYAGSLFQPSDLPANVPVKMHLSLNDYSCNTYDPNVGGYANACSLADAVPWNNAINIWMERVCP